MIKEYKVTTPDGVSHTLIFNPEGKGKNRYTIDGKPATGVTTILSAINKPALVGWAAKEAYTDCLNNNYTKEQIKEILETKSYAHTKKSDSAKDVGTEAHHWVEMYAKAKIDGTELPNIPEEIKPIVQPAIDWFEGRAEVTPEPKRTKYNKNVIEIVPQSIKFLKSEQSVFSPSYFYAGTFDLLLEINGKKYIADFKTSSGVYGREYYYQMAAYHNALRELGWGQDIVGSVIIRSGKGGNDLEVRVSESYEADFKCFRAAHILYNEGFTDKDI